MNFFRTERGIKVKGLRAPRAGGAGKFHCGGQNGVAVSGGCGASEDMDERTPARQELLRLLLEKWENNREFMSPEKFERFIDYKMRSHEFQDILIRRICLFEDVVSKRVLDAGSGEGGLVAALNLRGSVASGADIKQDNIRISKLRARLKGLNEDIFVHCDASRLPFADGVFDIVVMNEVLEHVSDVRATLKDVARVLKEGGLFFARVPNALWPFEGHVNLWFPHWLPRPARRAYVGALRPGKGPESNYLDDIRYHGYLGWKKEAAPFFGRILSNEILHENILAGRRSPFWRLAGLALAPLHGSVVPDVLSPTAYLVARK